MTCDHAHARATRMCTLRMRTAGNGTFRLCAHDMRPARKCSQCMRDAHACTLRTHTLRTPTHRTHAYRMRMSLLHMRARCTHGHAVHVQTALA
eukprot:6213620-Pleurochrysis_carterae.AAC.2